MTEMRFKKYFKDVKKGEMFLMLNEQECFVKTGNNSAARVLDLAKGIPVQECVFWCGNMVRCYEWDF